MNVILQNKKHFFKMFIKRESIAFVMQETMVRSLDKVGVEVSYFTESLVVGYLGKLGLVGPITKIKPKQCFTLCKTPNKHQTYSCQL